MRAVESAEGAALEAEFRPDLELLLGKSDVVSLHVPGGGGNRAI